MDAKARVVDALDIETFLICENEEEGRRISAGLMESMGCSDFDLVYIHHEGIGARVRIRAYVNRPGDRYTWLEGGEKDE